MFEGCPGLFFSIIYSFCLRDNLNVNLSREENIAAPWTLSPKQSKVNIYWKPYLPTYLPTYFIKTLKIGDSKQNYVWQLNQNAKSFGALKSA